MLNTKTNILKKCKKILKKVEIILYVYNYVYNYYVSILLTSLCILFTNILLIFLSKQPHKHS